MFHPFDLIWLAVPASIILQFVIIRRSSGPSRWVAALPLLVLIPIGVITVIDLAQRSNMWPVLLLLHCPVALLYLIVVACFVRPAAKQSPPAA